jgi:hypothetical protein
VKPSPWSCYNPRVILISLALAAVMIVDAVIGRGFPRGSAVRIALAAVNGLASSAVIVLTMLSIRSMDEMQQRIQLEALAIAFAGTGILATTYGFLQGAGLPPIEWGVWIWPAMVALWAIAQAFASRRYR